MDIIKTIDDFISQMPSIAEATITAYVTDGADDATINTAWSTISFTDTLIRLGRATDTYDGLMRFTGVLIPKGSKIKSAKISLYGDGAVSGKNVVTKIYGNDTDNAESPTNWAGYNGLNWTTAYADYVITAYPAGYFDTVDITSVIQEIVDRAGWASGNAMQFAIKNNGSASSQTAYVRSYNNNPSYKPILTVTFDYVQ